MNLFELDTAIPSVLDGSCPLGIFADMVDDCDLPKIADWIRRLFVNRLKTGNTDDAAVYYFVALRMEGMPHSYTLLTRGQGGPYVESKTEADAEKLMCQTAVTQVRPFIQAAEMQRGEQQGADEVMRSLQDRGLDDLPVAEDGRMEVIVNGEGWKAQAKSKQPLAAVFDTRVTFNG